jgi:hypothetical protein
MSEQNKENQLVETTTAISVEDFNDYISLLKPEVEDETNDLINSMSRSKSNRTLDIESMAFGSTTVEGTKIYKQSKNILWHDPDSETKESSFVGPFLPIAVRGFVLKAKDGLILYASDEMKAEASSDAKLPPVCVASSCTVGSIEFKGNSPSPFPLSSWLSVSKTSNKANAEITNLKLTGSRGESCTECIYKGHNVEGTVTGRVNKCQPTVGLLFAITHVAKANSKLAEGIEWFPITALHDEDMNPVYSSPVIVNIESTKSVNGSSGYNSVWVQDVGSVEAATASTGGRKYIPDDVSFFYNYWTQLRSQGFIRPARKGTKLPEHPRLPLSIPVQTEIYLATLQSPCAYATACPVFRTSGYVEQNPQLFSDYLQSMNTYITTYEDYLTKNNLTDNSYAEVDTSVKLKSVNSDETPKFNPSVYRPNLDDVA